MGLKTKNVFSVSFLEVKRILKVKNSLGSILFLALLGIAIILFPAKQIEVQENLFLKGFYTTGILKKDIFSETILEKAKFEVKKYSSFYELKKGLKQKEFDIAIIYNTKKNSLEVFSSKSILSNAAIARFKSFTAKYKEKFLFDYSEKNPEKKYILFPITLDLKEEPTEFRVPDKTREKTINKKEKASKPNTENAVQAITTTKSVNAKNVLPSNLETGIPLELFFVNAIIFAPSFFVAFLLLESIAQDKFSGKITFLLQQPIQKKELFLGKILPYLAFLTGYALWIAFHYSLELTQYLNFLLVFFSIAGNIFFSAILVSLTSKTKREMIFLSMISSTSFFAVFFVPNALAGISNLAFLTPVTLLSSILEKNSYAFTDVLALSFPHLMLAFSFLFFSYASFSPTFLVEKKGVKKIFSNASKIIYKKFKGFSPLILVFLFSPLVFVLEVFTAFSVFGFGAKNLLFGIAVLVLLEEIAKAVTINALPKKLKQNPVLTGILTGTGFFAGETGIKLFFVAKAISFLPNELMLLAIKNLFYTFLLHVSTATIFAVLYKKTSNFWFSVSLSFALHFTHNFYAFSGVI